MRFLRLLSSAIVAAVLPPFAHAAEAPADAPGAPFEVSEAARKAYAQTMQEARELLLRKQYDAAIAKLDQLATERPREPQARFLKGIALTDQKKTDAALAVYRGLVADFPEMPEPHNNLAVLYAQKGELGLARDELLLAIETAPDYAVARELGRRLCATGGRAVPTRFQPRQAQQDGAGQAQAGPRSHSRGALSTTLFAFALPGECSPCSDALSPPSR
jgi:Flp pilus assembly protein TadD